MKHTVTQLTKQQAQLQFYKSGVLTYSIRIAEDKEIGAIHVTTYTFPIDITDKKDVGEGRFNRDEKAIMLLRWINRAIKDGTIQVKEENVSTGGW